MPDSLHIGNKLPDLDPNKGADVFHEAGTGFSRYAFYFPLNGTELLPVHMPAIRELAEELKTGKYYEMYALADRSGSQQVNYEVSFGRYEAVEDGLLAAGFEGPDKLDIEKVFGEDFWAFMFNKSHSATFADGKQDARMRLVIVYVWPSPEVALLLHADIPLVEYGRTTRQPRLIFG